MYYTYLFFNCFPSSIFSVIVVQGFFISFSIYNWQAEHTAYRWNIKWPKFAGIFCLWVLDEIIKKDILKIWKKSWEPFWSYLLSSTTNPAHFHPNWAGMAEPFSRQVRNGFQIFFRCNILISFIFLNIKPLRPMPSHFWNLIFQMLVLWTAWSLICFQQSLSYMLLRTHYNINYKVVVNWGY